MVHMANRKPVAAPHPIIVCTIEEFGKKVPEIVKAAKIVFVTRHGRFVAAYIPIHLADERKIILDRLKVHDVADEMSDATRLGLGDSTAPEDIQPKIGG